MAFLLWLRFFFCWVYLRSLSHTELCISGTCHLTIWSRLLLVLYIHISLPYDRVHWEQSCWKSLQNHRLSTYSLWVYCPQQCLSVQYKSVIHWQSLKLMGRKHIFGLVIQQQTNHMSRLEQWNGTASQSPLNILLISNSLKKLSSPFSGLRLMLQKTDHM